MPVVAHLTSRAWLTLNKARTLESLSWRLLDRRFPVAEREPPTL